MAPSTPPPPMSWVIARIERELRDIWGAPAAGEPTKSRVCTMNLVVVTGSAEVADRYTRVVDEVTQATPSRAIVVTMNPTAAEAVLDGDVSAVCGVSEDGGAGALCSERVRLRASGAACARVGSAVDALLQPELPTTLIWLGRVHVEDPVFRELASDARRVVLDTEYTSLSSLLALARWAREAPGRPAVADLAWTRLSPWQEMCARFFDDPMMRPLALRIERLTVSQAGEKGSRLGSEAGLLVGWLATRLGWKIERLGGALRFRGANGKLVAVELRATPRPEGVAPFALVAVGLSASHEGARATAQVERKPGDATDVLHWRLDVDLPCAGEQTVRLGQNREARVLERTLHRPAHDPALAEAVAFAEQLDEDGVVCT